MPKITVLRCQLLRRRAYVWGGSTVRCQHVTKNRLLITGSNHRWTFAGQVGCPPAELIVDVVTLSGHTQVATGSLISPGTWLIHGPSSHGVAQGLPLRKTGASVAPLTFLASPTNQLRLSFSPTGHSFNVLSNSQVPPGLVAQVHLRGHHPTL